MLGILTVLGGRSGTEDDQPWYFDDLEEYHKAIAHADRAGLPYTVSADYITDAREFIACMEGHT